jgi:DNA-binding winged helix-turn-helix (wHTH) protein
MLMNKKTSTTRRVGISNNLSFGFMHPRSRPARLQIFAFYGKFMDVGTAGVPYLHPINGGFMSATYQSASKPARTFRFGEFTFDSGSRQLMRHGMERHLSPKAQHLLQLLLLVRPQALSREELYDALWPSTFVCETNLATIVNELRRALGDDARTSQFIRTVHGFGYAFCGEVAVPGKIPLVAATLVCDGKSYVLQEGSNEIGREPDCQIRLSDHTVSRRHALIVIDVNGFSIRDLNSKNGTCVDGQRIGRSPVTVNHGAQITFGGVVAALVFRKTSSTASLRLNMAKLRRKVDERRASA